MEGCRRLRVVPVRCPCATHLHLGHGGQRRSSLGKYPGHVVVPEAPRRAALLTLGCARNEVDSEELAGRLSGSGWDKNSTPPALPDEVVEESRRRYVKAFELLTGHPLPE